MKKLIGCLAVCFLFCTSIAYTVLAAEDDPPVWITCPSGAIVRSDTACPPLPSTSP